MKKGAQEGATHVSWVAIGVTDAVEISAEADAGYERWIAEGCHAGMEYLERHATLRRDLRNVLPGCRSVISAAFSFSPSRRLPGIAAYALAGDYHKIVKRELTKVVEWLRDAPRFADETFRICVDTAPVAERYWAVICGIGERTRSGMISVPGAGTEIFLGEILTTALLTPSASNATHFGASIAENDPSLPRCAGCDRCRRSCPAGALRADGSIDARRCVSYLTIEHRGDWDPGQRAVMTLPVAAASIYGCDRCTALCPLNTQHKSAGSVSDPADFNELFREPSPAALLLSEGQLPQPGQLYGTALKRAGTEGLARNLDNHRRE